MSSPEQAPAASLFSSKPACHEAALQLALCVEQKSPCVKSGGKIMDCIKKGDLGEGCESMNRGLVECRRSQLNMRLRFRGKKFQEFGKDKEEEEA